MPKARRSRKAARPKSRAKARPRPKARPKSKAKLRPKKVTGRRAKPAAPAPPLGPPRVKVPKTPKSAYNHNRPISDLVRNQIRHMQIAEQGLAPENRSLIPSSAIMTEREAGEYIQHVTAHLHPAGIAPSATLIGRRTPRGTK